MTAWLGPFKKSQKERLLGHLPANAILLSAIRVRRGKFVELIYRVSNIEYRALVKHGGRYQ